MPYIIPITDRTSADILAKTDKAFFNVADWIRINTNAEYVRALMNVLRGLNITFVYTAEPTIATIPSVDDINAFVAHIELLRLDSGLSEDVVVPLKDDYQAILNAPSPTYEDVNNWELDLQLIIALTISLSVYIVFCGVAAVGQPRFWQNRFRNRFVTDDTHPVQRPRCGVAVAGENMMMQNGWRRYAA